MAASRILPLARTSRWAMVVSGTMKARAISGVASPPRVRRVRATLASGARAGWQQVKISRSRSSAMVCISVSPRAASSRARVARRSASPRSRRSRSMALLRAVVVIQAPGRSGTPATGQRSTATRKASWTASSARSKSPRTRMRVATACPDSSRNTRSTSARVSSATLTLSSLGVWACGPDLGPPGGPSGRHVHLHDRPDLDRPAADVGDPGRDLDGLVQVLGLDNVEAAELLLGLGERPVGAEGLALAHPDGGGGGGRLERLAGLVDAAVDDVLCERHVVLELGLSLLLALARPVLLAGVDQQRVAHAPLPKGPGRRGSPPSMQPTSGTARNRHPPPGFLSAIVREAKRQSLVALLEQGDRLLEVVLALARDPELVALDLSLDLEAGLPQGLGQRLGLVLGDALQERALHPVVPAARGPRLRAGQRLE